MNQLLAWFVGRLEAVLGPDLVGVYLTGSFALGGGDAASDCDVLVVTAGTLASEHEQAVRVLHDELLDRPGYWAYNLEGSYAPEPDLRTLAALGRPWLYVDRGSRTMEWSAHDNTEDVRWVLRERPVILTGPDPREFACEVTAELLRQAMRPKLERFLDDLLSWTTFEISWTQRYAVEATARMLYTLEQGAVISKHDALAWVKDAMPAEWHELIEQVRRDRFVQWNAPAPSGSAERARAFVAYVQERARSYDSAP